VRVLQLEGEAADHARNGTPELCARKVLADAGALAVQEGDLGVVGRGAAVAVAGLAAGIVGVDPAVRQVLVTGGAPELRAAVDGVRDEQDARAMRYGVAGDDGVADGFADRGRHGGVQAEDLLADAVQEGHGFEVAPGDGVVGRGDALADFLTQAGLDVGVLAELVAAPRQGAGSGFVLCSGSAW
jgi:hypothetical protein